MGATTRMRHWPRVASLVVATVLAVGACKDEVATETPPAAAPAATPVVDASARAAAAEGGQAAEPRSEGEGGGGLLLRPAEPSSPAREGGLFGVTREMIDTIRRKESSPLRLVPDAARFVARMRPAVLFGHVEAQTAWAKAEGSDASFKAAMDVVRACLGRLEVVDDVVVGFDDAEHLVLAAHGKGLGTDVVWRCFQTEATARGQSMGMTITGTARGEGPQLRTDEGDLGYFPDDDTMVMVAKEWDADVRARMRGEGTPAIEGALAGPVGRIGPEDPLWLVGRLEGKPELGLLGTPFAGIDDVAFGLRIDGGDLVIATSIDAGEAADATRVRDEVHRQLDPMKSMLPMMGVPSSVVPKIAFVAEGDLVKLDFTLTSDELRELREGIARTF